MPATFPSRLKIVRGNPPTAEQAAPARIPAVLRHRQARTLLVTGADRRAAAAGHRKRRQRLSRDDLPIHLWAGRSCRRSLPSPAQSSSAAPATLRPQAARIVHPGCPRPRPAAIGGRRSPDFWPLGGGSADLPARARQGQPDPHDRTPDPLHHPAADVPVHGFETPICAYAALASGPIWSARTWAGVL